MSETPAVHSTFVVERRYPKPPATVFAAFADEATKRRWFADGGGHEVTRFETDFRPGGYERLDYRLGESTPFPGAEIANEERFCDIVHDRRIVTSSVMAFGGRTISVLLVTTELMPEGDGTHLVCTVQGVFFEGSDGPQIREHGWNVLLDLLGKVLADA
ncbi:SRPBCC family protein [Sphingomonas sp.]|uniref:SRPBCC family protein n=1 Tax=Sphingomonas sp. TaxID=28214 RepID=UPI001B1AE8A7|nr:SRPBCC family protein [Sphingomonas sp.]MBO9712882.1 SRPBCC family protein [Sphingomonas sp.]